MLKARRHARKRFTQESVVFVSTALVVTYLASFYLIDQKWPWLVGSKDDSLSDDALLSTSVFLRKLLSVNDTTSVPNNATNTTTQAPSSGGGIYPPELFTVTQLEHGAVVLYILGMIYMFVALAIICDEFFVPALGVITETFNISDDVAGATFMAAGGSAPELFTSIIGVFLAKNDVGIGTIVGSAVFNILFVIGMCALFSKSILSLTWWPLFRDVMYYSVALILLIVFFNDRQIEWWESLILLLWYACYVIFMKFNHNIEATVKQLPCLKQNRISSGLSGEDLIRNRSGRRSSLPMLRGGSAKYRHGVLQLMIHTIDPLTDSRHVNDKAVSMHAVASLKVVINGDQNDNSKNGVLPPVSNGHITIDGTFTATNGPTYMTNGVSEDGGLKRTATSMTTLENSSTNMTDVEHIDRSKELVVVPPADRDSSLDNNDEEEDEKPLDMSWPDSYRERITYVLLIPITFPLWLMIPDVRNPEKRKWFYITFILSIAWIGIFSYLMVWWADVTGTTIGLPPEVMGLTVLAAGTSVPDLLTSVIVARKGLGDMAVSSSVGSNIFDITVGLPFPWILWSIINSGPVKVDSKGLFCSIILLFGMLLLVISSIALFRWKMSK